MVIPRTTLADVFRSSGEDKARCLLIDIDNGALLGARGRELRTVTDELAYRTVKWFFRPPFCQKSHDMSREPPCSSPAVSHWARF